VKKKMHRNVYDGDRLIFNRFLKHLSRAYNSLVSIISSFYSISNGNAELLAALTAANPTINSANVTVGQFIVIYVVYLNEICFEPTVNCIYYISASQMAIQDITFMVLLVALVAMVALVALVHIITQPHARLITRY